MTARRHKNFIDGSFRKAERYIDNFNPSDTSDTVGQYAVATPAEVAEAGAAARRAAPEWAASGIQQRSDILDKAGAEIAGRAEELGDLLAREEGKTRPEAIAEVKRAAQIFKFFAGEALRLGGERLPSVRPGLAVEIAREPVGVVAAITPWNFPIAIPAWKVAPALAFGNCVLLKPSELAPGCAWALAEILSRAGLPEGVFNLVMGPGADIGDTLVDLDEVDAVSFTGSVATGSRILQRASARRAKVQMEMGGKNPLVVLDDADLDVAVDCTVQGAFFSTGQRCTASSRIIVTEGLYDRFLDALRKSTAALAVGDARAEGTQIGPVISERQRDRILDYLASARAEGAEIEGGETVAELPQGYFLRPAIVTGVDNSHTINREEVFGPVASVLKVRDYDEALSIANDTDFGLTSGICTRSLKYAEDFKRKSTSGMVMVNLPTAGVDYHVPFGGRGASSFGPREQGSYAQEFYTTIKTSYVRAV